MLIRIRNTTFGLVVNGIVKPKTPADPPFEVDEELGIRLVREGVAEAIGSTVFSDVENNGESVDNNTDSDDSEEIGNFDIPEYGEETSKADLQSIAKEYGVVVASNATKADIIKALDDFFADALPDGSEDE